LTIENLADLDVTDAQLASLAGVSSRRIRQLAEQGAIERQGPNRYRLGDAFRSLIDDAAGAGSELQKQRIRKTKADADRVEFELLKARGEVAPVSDFERAQAAFATTIRANVMNVPARAVLQLLGETNETVFKEKLRAELVRALTAAADAPLALNDEP
jgi:phage terminase Nu1 subunit (DNA packaging protein)